ncbi:aminotransferase, class IV [Sulfurimonas gotlandica GD1]|uniref:Aminotransferase, class IV n=1 Tax=Sulfurimonas gotlandica (strain DSM 19862 / JCM 16533 / GD1) TaxID=929558 RepID=B6BMA7_SULGG|nr:aminotransferase class IV family protein [Sulfurimonas gotlandica]EDZ61744.1 IlvE protein [Sulfurimonas gotlandica GD1]EHP29315.1 aminotransferase, class IV [Sulfurimonas gotlandica GD1]
MSEIYLETIKAFDGEIFNLLYHQKRYESVLRSLGCSDLKNLKEYLKPPISGLYRCRLTYNTNKIDVAYHEYNKREIKTLKLVFDDDIYYSKKSTNRDELNRLFEKRENCDDILIVKNSLVSDTSITNIAFYKSGLWFTPKKPLLEGTTRQRLLDEGKIIEKDIRVEDLKNYSKIALMNAMIDFDIITKYNLKDIIC